MIKPQADPPTPPPPTLTHVLSLLNCIDFSRETRRLCAAAANMTDVRDTMGRAGEPPPRSFARLPIAGV